MPGIFARPLWGVWLLFFPLRLAAQGQSPAPALLTDREIEAEKKAAEASAEQRIADIKSQGSLPQVEEERIAFWRKGLEERKAFLDSLKAEKPQERRKAYEAFREEQKQKKEAFKKDTRRRLQKSSKQSVPKRGNSEGLRSKPPAKKK